MSLFFASLQRAPTKEWRSIVIIYRCTAVSKVLKLNSCCVRSYGFRPRKELRYHTIFKLGGTKNCDPFSLLDVMFGNVSSISSCHVFVLGRDLVPKANWFCISTIFGLVAEHNNLA